MTTMNREEKHSAASVLAKKLNLIHVGNGSYVTVESGPITHITKDGKLIKAENAVASAKENNKVTKEQLSRVKHILQSKFNKVNVDLQFSNHFIDRINDDRNETKINIKDIEHIFNLILISIDKLKALKHKELEAVIKSRSTNINMPIAFEYRGKTDKGEDDFYLRPISIYRKSNFYAKGKTIMVENIEGTELLMENQIANTTINVDYTASFKSFLDNVIDRDSIVYQSVINYVVPTVKQISNSFQVNVDQAIEKVNNEFKKFGYIVDARLNDDSFEKEGTGVLLIRNKLTKELCWNLYFHVNWEKLTNGQQYEYRPEGSKLRMDITFDPYQPTLEEFYYLLTNVLNAD